MTQLKPSPLKGDAGLPRILIHASSSMDRNAFDEEEETGRWGDVPNYFQELDLEALPKSAIIGSVRLLGIIDVPEVFQQVEEVDMPETPMDEYSKLRTKFGLKTSAKSLALGKDCVEWPPFYEGEQLFWWFVDRPIPLDQPILEVKGKLNLWTYPIS